MYKHLSYDHLPKLTTVAFSPLQQTLPVSIGFFLGERQGNLNNSFQIPEYLRTDVAIFYNKHRFRTALNFINLFDIDYFVGSNGFSNFVDPGEPLTVEASVLWEF